MIEVPDIETLKKVMHEHFENGRISEAWGLREHWYMEYQSAHCFYKRKHKKPREQLQALVEIKDDLRMLFDELNSKYNPKELRNEELIMLTNPFDFLDFIEEKLKEYGSKLNEPGGATYSLFMRTLIMDMFRFFDVDDVYMFSNIEDEQIRHKVIELTRLNMRLHGANTEPVKQKVKPKKKAPEKKSLANLL